MLKSIFKEFFILGYKESENPWKGTISDWAIDRANNIVLRKCDSGIIIYYLNTGNNIVIPWEWIDLFSSLRLHSGDKILSINVPDSDSISKFIYNFVRLVGYLDSENTYFFLPTVLEICKTRSKAFREWIKQEFNLYLPDINFITSNNFTTI